MAKDLLIKQFEKTQNSYLEVKPLKAQVNINGKVWYLYIYIIQNILLIYKRRNKFLIYYYH